MKQEAMDKCSIKGDQVCCNEPRCPVSVSLDCGAAVFADAEGGRGNTRAKRDTCDKMGARLGHKPVW